MSSTHPPHSIPSLFTLQIGASSSSKSTPPRLRCPEHLRVGFEARWHDLRDPLEIASGVGGGAWGTPWVGCVDLEGYFFNKFSSPASIGLGLGMGVESTSLPTRGRSILQSPTSSPAHSYDPSAKPRQPTPHAQPLPPPPFPGYRLPSRGLLQLVVKNTLHALKVFLLEFDLSALEVGGKMLLRERGYQEIRDDPAPQNGSRKSSFGAVEQGRREVLRWAVEVQFICVEDLTETSPKPKKKQDKRRRASIRPGGGPEEGFTGALPLNISNSGRSTPVPGYPRGRPLPRTDGDEDDDAGDEGIVRAASASRERVKKKKRLPSEGGGKSDQGKAFYLTKTIRIVFPPLSGSSSSSPTSTGTASGTEKAEKALNEKPQIRTERFIEVINPLQQVNGESKASKEGRGRKESFGSESWEGIRSEWARRERERVKEFEAAEEEDEEDERRGDRAEEEEVLGDLSLEMEEMVTGTAPRTEERKWGAEKIAVRPRAVKMSSLLSAEFEGMNLVGKEKDRDGRRTPVGRVR